MQTLTKIPLGPAANTPGEILAKEFLEPLGLSQNQLATKLDLPRMLVSEIIRGRRRITAKTAIAMGEGLGTGPQFWLDLQSDYDLAIEAKKAKRKLSKARKVVSSFFGGYKISAIREDRVLGLIQPAAAKTAKKDSPSSGRVKKDLRASAIITKRSHPVSAKHKRRA